MDVEQAFAKVGAFGKHQVICYSLLAAIQIMLGCQMIQNVIVGSAPKLSPSTRGKMVSNMTTIVTEWRLYGSLWVVNLIQSIFMAGVLVGNMFIGQLSDLYGRKNVLYKVLGLLIFTSFLTSFANNYQVYAALRFFVGVFQGGTVLVSFVLAQELLGSSAWTLSGNIFPAMFALGIISFGGLGSIFPEWRHLCLATSIPGTLLLIGYFIVPESPRWLYSQGKTSDAENVLKLLARKNGKSSKTCDSIILALKSSSGKSKAKRYSVRDLFSFREIGVRTLALCYLWFVCSFTYYGLTMGAGDLSSNLYASVALSGLVELPSYVLCCIVVDRPWAGRRKTLIGMLLFGGMACIAIMFVHVGEKGQSNTKMAFGLLGKLAVSAAFATVYIFASELFPTVVRNVGMGTTSVCARIGGILAPFTANLSSWGNAAPYVVYGTVALIAGAVGLVLPETLNEPIPDTLDDVQAMKSTKASYNAPEDKVELLADDV